MQVLALDTASPAPSVTLLAHGEAWEERLPDDRRSSEELLPAISRCLAAARTALDRAFDGVRRHVLVARLVDRQTQPGVHGGVASAFSG